MAKRDRLVGHGAHAKEMASLLRDNARRHRLHAVFSDFCELAALSISNAVDKTQFDAREARYLQIVARYEREEVERFPQLLGVLADWLGCGFGDCLGALFMSLELGDDFKGQFFTPYELSSMMARMVMGDVRERVEAQGFITVNEPACGAGGMVVACADAIHAQGINYQQVMHATAQDVDATAVHMAYVQLSLLHVPAIVLLGNSLSVEVREHWVTPAHVVGGWDRRLRAARAAADSEKRFEVPELVSSMPEATAVHAPQVSTADPMIAARQAVVESRALQLGLFD